MDGNGHCLICEVSDSEASGAFCCEACLRPEALTMVCRQCDGVVHHERPEALRVLAGSIALGGFRLSFGDIVVMPYCSACTEIAPKRPLGEIEVYSISQK